MKQVYEVAGPKRVPIIGQGGIASALDAIEFMIAGASAIGLGTALFYDPLLCPKVNEGIAKYLRSAGMASVAELTRFAACGPRGRLRQLARHFSGDIQPDCCGAADGGGMLIDRLVGYASVMPRRANSSSSRRLIACCVSMKTV